METIIVSRHPGQIEWLAARGITGRVIDRATADDVRGKHVVGTLPLELAAEAAKVSLVRFTSPDARRRLSETQGDIPFAEMDSLGAELVHFVVRREEEIAAATNHTLAELEEARVRSYADREWAHSDADASLLRLIEGLIFSDAITKAFEKIKKWYA